MAWPASASTDPTPFEGVLALRPELLPLFKRFYGQFWENEHIIPNLTELARLRIAQVHDCESQFVVRTTGSGVSDAQIAALAEWQDSPLFSTTERAALAIADKVPWQHHDITDDEAAELRVQIGEPAFVAFMTACALFDASCRLRLVFEVEPRAANVPLPASADGVLY